MSVPDCVIVDTCAYGIRSFVESCRNIDNFPPGNDITKLAEVSVHFSSKLAYVFVRIHLEVIQNLSDLRHIHFLPEPRFEKRFDEVPLFLESFFGILDEFEPRFGIGVQGHTEVIVCHWLSPCQGSDGRIDAVD